MKGRFDSWWRRSCRGWGQEEQLEGLFACGYLRVGDRALGIEAGREAEGITLQLKYLDNRGPEETLPLMEKLILNSQEG